MRWVNAVVFLVAVCAWPGSADVHGTPLAAGAEIAKQPPRNQISVNLYSNGCNDSGSCDVNAKFGDNTGVYRMPCPVGLIPDRVAASWSQTGQFGDGAGHRVIRQAREVRALYRAFCHDVLIKYPHRVTYTCYGYLHGGLYHLEFLRKQFTLLSITEKAAGCIFVTVTGHPELGFTQSAYLPRGVPRPDGSVQII